MVKVNTADKNSKKVCLLNNVCQFEKLMDEELQEYNFDEGKDINKCY